MILFIFVSRKKKTEMKDRIKVVAFDADDTLWENQAYFDEAQLKFSRAVTGYADPEQAQNELYHTEIRNLDTLGYGVMAFTMSMIETALRLSGDTIPASRIHEIYNIGRELLKNPATPYPEVEDTLRTIAETTPYKLIVITKGNTTDQENKLERSGLTDFFSHIEIVPDKNEEAYGKIIDVLGIKAEELLMVGNSFKSDIAPVLKLGGYGVHIPAQSTWQHEVIEEFDHSNLFRISHFRELLDIL